MRMPIFERRRVALGLFLFSPFLLFACSSSSPHANPAGQSDPDGGNPGNARDPGADAASAGPRPLCGGSVTFPADLGSLCGAGSNETYCATPESACSSGACLWDGVASSAYCTVGCDPGSASACPSGWTCMAQGCDVGTPPNVCVETGGTAGSAPACTLLPSSTPGGASFQPQIYFATASSQFLFGTSSASAGMTLVVLSAPTGSTAWTQAYSAPTMTNVSRRGFAVDGTAVYLATEVGLFRLEGSTASLELAPTSSEELAGVFRAEDGSIHAITEVFPNQVNPVSNVYARDASGSWSMSGHVDLLLADVTALGAHGFAAACNVDAQWQLCMGDTGADAAEVAMPAGEAFGGHDETGLLAAGSSPEDFVVITGSSSVYHSSGGRWFKDGTPAGRAAGSGGFAEAGFFTGYDGTLYAILEQPLNDAGSFRGELYRLDASCWTPLGGPSWLSQLPAAPLPGGGFATIGQQGLCSVKP